MKFFFSILILFFSAGISAQVATVSKQDLQKSDAPFLHSFGGQIAYSFQTVNRVEAGINYLWGKRIQYSRSKTIPDTTNPGNYLTVDVAKENIFTFGPQLSEFGYLAKEKFYAGQSFGFTAGECFNKKIGVNAGLLIEHFNKNDFGFSSGVGISFAELIYVNYYYSFPLKNPFLPDFGNNRIGIVFRFNKVPLAMLFERG